MPSRKHEQFVIRIVLTTLGCAFPRCPSPGEWEELETPPWPGNKQSQIGRFAISCEEVFGESPSQTLRRSYRARSAVDRLQA